MEILVAVLFIYIVFKLFSGSGNAKGRKCPSCGKKAMVLINTWKSPKQTGFCPKGLFRYDEDYECQNCKHRETESHCIN